MIREAIEEAKQTAEELPAFTAAVLMLVALCIGAHCAVFYEADGEQLKLTAADSMSRTATKSIDAIGRMRSRAECAMKTPGFTVIVGLRHYEMELSVPIASVQSLFENARTDVVRVFAPNLNMAA
jgi:hypothetical protein